MQGVDYAVSVFYRFIRVKTLKFTGKTPSCRVGAGGLAALASTKYVACLNAEDLRTRVRLSSPPPSKNTYTILEIDKLVFYRHKILNLLLFKVMNRNKKAALLFLLFSVVSCDLAFLGVGSSQSSQVPGDNLKIFVVPIDDEKTPLIFIQESKGKICRRRPLDTDYGLEPEETTDNSGGATAENETPEARQNNESNQPIPIDVAANWFQVGLVVANKHNSYYAIIEQLRFIMSAKYGSETLQGSKEISSGYCQSNPLYIAPPLQKGAKPNAYRGEPFEPLDPKSRNNLILFVDGVPIPTDYPKEEEGSGGLTNIRQTAERAESRGGANARGPFILESLPKYTVRLQIIGYWIDKQRKRKAILRKTVTFNLSSTFLN